MQLNSNVSVSLLLDDALWVDVAPFNASTVPLQAQAQGMLALVNGTGAPQTCRKAQP